MKKREYDRPVRPLNDPYDDELDLETASRIIKKLKGIEKGERYTIQDFVDNSNRYRDLFRSRSSMDSFHFAKEELLLNYKDIDIRKDLQIWEKKDDIIG